MNVQPLLQTYEELNNAKQKRLMELSSMVGKSVGALEILLVYAEHDDLESLKEATIRLGKLVMNEYNNLYK